MTFYIETVERVRRKASRGTEGSVGKYEGKRREVRREAPGGTEGSAGRYGGISNNDRREDLRV